MPTLVLVDVSLSMGRVVGEGAETGRGLAAAALRALGAAVATAGVERLEWGSVAALSHDVVPVQDWTRDWEALASAAQLVRFLFLASSTSHNERMLEMETGTKKRLDAGLEWARGEAGGTWPAGAPLHLLLLTDSKGISDRAAIARLFPFHQPLRLHVIVLANSISPAARVNSSPQSVVNFPCEPKTNVNYEADLEWLVETANASASEAFGQPPISGLHFLVSRQRPRSELLGDVGAGGGAGGGERGGGGGRGAGGGG